MSWEFLLHAAVLLAGVVLIVLTVAEAIRSFILPRGEATFLSSRLLRTIRYLFDLAAARTTTYVRRDRILALYAPVALVALPIFWLALLSLAYTGIFWALGEGDWEHCYRLSNNSLLTLGAEKPKSTAAAVFSYSEATLGLLLLTLLISYLPTLYQTFARRELVVARLELRAGAPNSATELIAWLNRSGSLIDDDDQWLRWEEWFVEIEESHTSIPILSFFRSPQPGRSWVAAAGIILDTAALIFSTVDQPRSPQTELCFKAGCIALNRVYRFFDERARSRPTDAVNNAAGTDQLEDPTRREFEEAYDQLAKHGIRLHADRDAAWQKYHTLRGRYSTALVFMAKLTVAPEVKPIQEN